MIKVTDEMKDKQRKMVVDFIRKNKYYTNDNINELVKSLIELHEANKPKPEPVAWMSPNKERLEFSRIDTVYGSHTIPLYTTPPTREPYIGERIICAAIMNPSLGVFCGFRHNNCINQSGKYHYRTHDDELWKQGFITTDNGRFVDRAEAWVIADKAGQIINRGEGIDGLLFSENLY